MRQTRHFLFLQGPLSPLYARIADILEREGHRVERINLCVGDALDWRRPGATSFRGHLADWPGFIDDFLVSHGITDVILHGDRRAYHKIAGDMARRRGMQVIATELGYLRPDWMTIERDGTSSGSHFPRDPAAIRQIAEAVEPIDFKPLFRNRFSKVAIPDVRYNMANTLLWFLYPHYQRHTIYFPPLEYAAWFVRLLTERTRQRRALARTRELIDSRTLYFVVPLQLEGDFQIRDHSSFGSISDALALIMRSFAAHAPETARLVIKNHPLDNGLEHWPRVIAALAVDHGIESRVDFLDGGRLDRLVEHAQGLVTINSSAGLEALIAECPVKTLAPAIYDIKGMTHQGPLDGFWSSPETPDAELGQMFMIALAAMTQVRGTIYDDDGLTMAAKNMARRILANAINTPLDAPSAQLAT